MHLIGNADATEHKTGVTEYCGSCHSMKHVEGAVTWEDEAPAKGADTNKAADHGNATCNAPVKTKQDANVSSKAKDD